MRKMKDSGIEWIGDIPEEWKVVKISNVIDYTRNSINKNEDKEVLSLSINGIKIKNNLLDGMNPTDYSNHQIAQIGDLVICLRDLDGPLLCGVSKFEGCLSKLYYVYKFKENANYYNYIFHCMDWCDYLDTYSYGMRHSYNNVQFCNLYTILPSTIEQELIVDYLDEKIQKIDNIISKTQKTIEEYKKYKQSIITAAVTKGLNPNVEMKDSGIEWIGKIPKDIKLIKLKYIFEIKKDIAGKEGYDILSVTQLGIKLKDLSKNEGQIATNYSNYQFVNKDDFVMNHMDLLTGWVDCSRYNGVTSPDYRVFKFINSNVHSKEYYKYLMQICYSNKIFYGLGQGVSNLGRWRLQKDKFMNFYVPVFNLKQQKYIATYLDKKCSEIDTLITKKQELITQLETYKKSLIYECVTGKKEVLAYAY